jgi:hypothetical protein
LKNHGLLYHSTLGSRATEKKREGSKPRDFGIELRGRVHQRVPLSRHPVDSGRVTPESGHVTPESRHFTPESGIVKAVCRRLSMTNGAVVERIWNKQASQSQILALAGQILALASDERP